MALLYQLRLIAYDSLTSASIPIVFPQSLVLIQWVLEIYQAENESRGKLHTILYVLGFLL